MISPRTETWKVEIVSRDGGRGVTVDPTVIDGDSSELILDESRLFYVRGALTPEDIESICWKLLCDPVSEKYHILPSGESADEHAHALIEIIPRPGVMDPVALSTEKALRELGFEVEQVRTGRRYRSKRPLSDAQLRRIAERALGNALIEKITCAEAGGSLPAVDPFVQMCSRPLVIKSVGLRDLVDEKLLELSRRGHLFLNVAEMRAIRDHYLQVGRDPTDVELETLAQTWSEHCVHKTLKSAIHYQGAGFPEEIRLQAPSAELPRLKRRYTNLLVETIVQATRTVNKLWCLSVFEDNAGVITFDDHFGVAFKVETHNHPSALEPYGGAATGIGGCIRDILGCGLGAKPVANTDVFCFAPPDLPPQRVPAGVFPPARSMREVVRGVRDYGNRMGIPTVNGALAFDERFLGNPLVFCGCIGLIPKAKLEKAARQGDRIVVIGGRTGRDGIHGATFSSAGMTDTHVDEFAHAVQIGNAITEKKMMDVLLQARDQGLYHAVTDCGAGGLSSAVGEMGRDLGVVVELDRVPLKYSGLRYDEIWISEAQERMVLAVAPEQVQALLVLCASEDVEATDIGVFTGDGKLVLRFEGQVVGDMEMGFLHEGLPRGERSAHWVARAGSGSAGRRSLDWEGVREELLNLLSSPSIASKEWIIRQYDHEVQGGSAIKPLMGPGCGPTDGAVVRPLPGSHRGIALSCGLCPQISDVDPYVMAVAALDEAVRNNLCVGGSLEQMALLDNFCWGGVDSEEQLGGLVRAAQGCHDAAVAYGAPFISGKDSLNNVFKINPEDAARMNWPQTMSIPGTLLISAVSVVEDVRRCRSSDFKVPGDKLFRLKPSGTRLADLAAAARAVSDLLSRDQSVSSCHDCSEGGLLVAIAEMVIGSRFGARLELGEISPDELFTENIGCYVVERSTDHSSRWTPDARLQTIELGTVIHEPRLVLNTEAANGQPIEWHADQLRDAWRRTFDWK